MALRVHHPPPIICARVARHPQQPLRTLHPATCKCRYAQVILLQALNAVSPGSIQDSLPYTPHMPVMAGALCATFPCRCRPPRRARRCSGGLALFSVPQRSLDRALPQELYQLFWFWLALLLPAGCAHERAHSFPLVCGEQCGGGESGDARQIVEQVDQACVSLVARLSEADTAG
jgi:hypothetical protein